MEVEDKKEESAVNDSDANSRRRCIVRVLQLLHLIVLPLLLFLYLLYCVDRQTGPVYRLVVGTPVERLCLRVLPYFWRHRSFLERQAMNASLTPDERTRSKLILKRMERIRPTHTVELVDGEMLFGRLREAREGEDCDWVLRVFDGARTSERKLMKAEVKVRRTLVSPTVPMKPRDIRFLLDTTDMNHFYLHPYLVASDGDFRTALELYTILSQLSVEFRREFGALIGEDRGPLIHVRHFVTKKALAEAAAMYDAVDLINASAFFRKSDNCLFLCDDLTSSHLFAHRRFVAASNSATVDRFERMRHTRHEGAHQLAMTLGVFRDRGDVPFWLEEGLAQYCEQSPLGSDQPEKTKLLRKAQASGKLLPLAQLLALSPEVRRRYSAERQQIIYAQSWLLFRLLMSKAYRPRFFRYLLSQTNSPQSAEAISPDVVLCNALETSSGILERKLREAMSAEP